MLSEPSRTEIQPGPAGVKQDLELGKVGVVGRGRRDLVDQCPSRLPDLVTLAGTKLLEQRPQLAPQEGLDT